VTQSHRASGLTSEVKTAGAAGGKKKIEKDEEKEPVKRGTADMPRHPFLLRAFTFLLY